MDKPGIGFVKLDMYEANEEYKKWRASLKRQRCLDEAVRRAPKYPRWPARAKWWQPTATYFVYAADIRADFHRLMAEG